MCTFLAFTDSTLDVERRRAQSQRDADDRRYGPVIEYAYPCDRDQLRADSLVASDGSSPGTGSSIALLIGLSSSKSLTHFSSVRSCASMSEPANENSVVQWLSLMLRQYGMK